MNQLDNRALAPAGLARKANKIGLFLLLISLQIGAGGCRKTPPVNSGTAVVGPAGDAVAEADQLYAGRQDLMKVRRALVALRQAQASDPSNYELAWRLAKFNYYLGAQSQDETEKEKAFRDGIEAGKLAVQLKDNKPEGHFWLGANYGGSAETSTLAGLSAIEDIKDEMETVLKIDEGYEGGSAYMVLGQMYFQAPLLLGGDRQKGLQYLEKGSRLKPGNVLLHLRLAEAYLAVNRKDDARQQVNTVLTMKPDPDHLPEDSEALAQARKLQEKLK